MKEIKVPINPTYYEKQSAFAVRWEESRSERYKEYRKKWNDNPQAFKLENGPLHLDIEPTSACNLKCPMCPRTVLVESGAPTNFHLATMDLDFYKNLIDQAAEMGVYSIKLNWLGEPLVHKGIVEMVSYAKQKGIVDVMMNTNAALLSEDMSRRLIEAGLDKIFFSFDSPYKDEYEKIRVGASYEETLINIKKLVEIRGELNSDTPLTRVSMVIMEENKKDYDEFVKLFKDFIDVIGHGDFVDPEKDFSEGFEKKPAFACSQLWQRMFIAADGEVVVCCLDSDREYVAGNAHESRLADIWNGDRYKHIRELHKNGDFDQIPMCKKCFLPYMTE